MKTYICNINKINEDVETFVIVKSKIESWKIEEGLIKEKNTIQEYIASLGLEKNIFMSNDQDNLTIPFNIFKTGYGEFCIVYCYDKNDDNYTKFLDRIEKIKYDLTKLTKINQIDVIQGSLGDNSYFIINQEFYL